MVDEQIPCPACGGAGGGPIGRAGSAWDDETYVCPRCEGVGVVAVSDASVRPGLAKSQGAAASSETAAKRKAAG
jgi:hypothetical protein